MRPRYGDLTDAPIGRRCGLFSGSPSYTGRHGTLSTPTSPGTDLANRQHRCTSSIHFNPLSGGAAASLNVVEGIAHDVDDLGRGITQGGEGSASFSRSRLWISNSRCSSPREGFWRSPTAREERVTAAPAQKNPAPGSFSDRNVETANRSPATTGRMVGNASHSLRPSRARPRRGIAPHGSSPGRRA